MDMLSIKTPLLKGIFAGILSKELSKIVSANIAVTIDDMEISYDGETGMADLKVKVATNDVQKLLEKMGLK